MRFHCTGRAQKLLVQLLQQHRTILKPCRDKFQPRTNYTAVALARLIARLCTVEKANIRILACYPRRCSLSKVGKGKVAPAGLEPTWYQALATLTMATQAPSLPNSLLISNGATLTE